MEKIIDRLYENGISTILATPTGARPRWMAQKYPEVLRVDASRHRNLYGERHNHCYTSPVYREKTRIMNTKLAEKFKDHPGVIAWHISNEYGGECHCPLCQAAFKNWLKDKYQTADKMNRAWATTFWSHRYNDFDQVDSPSPRGDSSLHGLNLDWKRFVTDQTVDFVKWEIQALRDAGSDKPTTINMMYDFQGLNYHKFADVVDFVSWDNYPSYDTPWSSIAMTHDLMRGLKDEPFMLMEQTPSQQNWQKYNSLKRPGQMRAQSYQTLAHGADTIQFFQLRRSVGGCEKFHGAVIAHAGSENTRVFREVAQLGAELESFGDRTLGSRNEAEVGLIFDWDNYWALEYTSGPSEDLKYVDQIHQYYQYFYKKNIGVDMIPVDADFSKYKIVVAPVLYMVKDGMKEALENFVKNGGILITTFMSGIVGQSDNVYLGGYPGPLREMAGVWVEEIDALAPEQKNKAKFADGSTAACGLLCDLMHLEGAKALASYEEDFYAGMPAASKNTYGKGTTYYIATQFEEEGLAKILDQAVQEAGVSSVIPEETGLEVVTRVSDTTRFYFVM